MIATCFSTSMNYRSGLHIDLEKYNDLSGKADYILFCLFLLIHSLPIWTLWDFSILKKNKCKNAGCLFSQCAEAQIETYCRRTAALLVVGDERRECQEHRCTDPWPHGVCLVIHNTTTAHPHPTYPYHQPPHPHPIFGWHIPKSIFCAFHAETEKQMLDGKAFCQPVWSKLTPSSWIFHMWRENTSA